MPSADNDTEELVEVAEVESQVDSAAPPVEEAPETTAAEQPKPSWYQQLGDDYAELSEDAALERVRHSLSRQQELEQSNQQFQYMLWQQRQQQAQAQQPAQPKAEKPKWNAPEFDPRWLESVIHDKEKGLIPKHSGIDPTLPSKITAWANHRDDVATRIARDPVGFFKENVLDSLNEHFEQIVQQRLAQHQQIQAINNFESQHADILYGPKAAIGGPLTEAGREIVTRAVQLANMGVGDQLFCLKQAMQDLHYKIMVNGQLQQKTQQSLTDTNAKKKVDLLRSAANGSRRAPSKAVPSEATGSLRPRQSFQDIAKQNLEAAGIGMHDQVA